MGIYSINSINEASASSYLDDIQLEEVFEENYMEAALRHTYEIQENMNNVMKAIGIAELAEYEQTGREIDYVNESVSSVFNKIKEMLKKVWQKITSLFTKFTAKMQSFSKDDAEFVKKYRQQIVTGDVKGLKVKGYKFTISGVLKANEMTDKLNADAIASIVVKLGDNIDISKLNFSNGLPTESDVEIMKELNKSVSAVDNNDIMDNIRGSLFKGESTLDQKEFNKKLFEVFRNNENKITFDVFYFTNDKFEIMRITFSRLDAEYSFCWKQYTDSCLQCGWKVGYGLREFKNDFEYHLNNVLTVYCK